MRIRRLGIEDFAALLEYDWSPLIGERDTIYLFLARDHGQCSMVAEDDGGAPVGYAVGARSADGSSVFVFHVHVRADRRLQGVGSALMDGLERAARECGAARIWFLARERVKPFYARLGYREHPGDLPAGVVGYLARAKAATVMEKEL